MGLLQSRPWDAYQAFAGGFMLTFVVSLAQTIPVYWILFVGFFFLFLHSRAPIIDTGNTKAFVSMFKGITGGEGINLVDYGINTGLQFGGAFLGALVFTLIYDTPSAITTGMKPTMYDDDGVQKPAEVWGDGALIIFFLFANMLQAGCFYCLKNDGSLSTAFGYTVTYMLSWAIAQVSFPNSLGGWTIDFARMLVAKMLKGGDKMGEYGDNFDKFWVVIVGAFGGLAAGCALAMIEDKIKAKQGDGAETSAPAAEEA